MALGLTWLVGQHIVFNSPCPTTVQAINGDEIVDFFDLISVLNNQLLFWLILNVEIVLEHAGPKTTIQTACFGSRFILSRFSVHVDHYWQCIGKHLVCLACGPAGDIVATQWRLSCEFDFGGVGTGAGLAGDGAGW